MGCDCVLFFLIVGKLCLGTPEYFALAKFLVDKTQNLTKFCRRQNLGKISARKLPLNRCYALR